MMVNVECLKDPCAAELKKLKTEDFLRKIIIFRELSPSSIQVIERRIKTLLYKKGEQVILEEDAAKGVFFVYSGAVKLTKQDDNGNEIIVCIKQQGDIFAEASLFTQKTEHYPATATMLQEGKVLFLDKEELEKELYECPELAIQMIRYMSDTLREMTGQFRDIVLLDVYSKTVKTLERLGQKFNTDGNRWDIEIPLTVQEFASTVGATRESISRVFSKLKKQEMIDVKSRKIIILDWCKFCTLLHPHL